MKSKTKIIIYIFCTITMGVLINVWASSNVLTTNSYRYDTPKIQNELTILVLSDLHGHEFGNMNKKLITYVNAQEPDLILILGDMLNADSENIDIPRKLIQELKQSTPIYYALGNHELEYMYNKDSDLIEELENAGAIVLDKQYVDMDVAGEKIRLGGLYEYAFGLNGEDEASETPDEIQVFLKDFQNTDRLKIMMSHRPDSFVLGNASSYWDIDCVVSGHLHGGQVVLPFLGGVFGGDQGYFPEYVHGMYKKDKMSIFVTSGLGSNPKLLPRINNLPEIAVLELKR